MKNKEGFYKTIRNYLKKGTMRPVYCSDTLSILAVADSFYIASDYTQNKDGYVGFLVNSRMVRAMLVDEQFLEHLMLTAAAEELKQMMFRLTDQTFRDFGKTGMHDPLESMTHKFVDREMEKWITETYGAPQLPEAAKSKGLLALFRK